MVWQHGAVITARKRSLLRLCFYTCLSVILFMGGGGGVPGQVPPLGRYTPRQVHLLTVPAGIRSTGGRYASHWNAFLSIIDSEVLYTFESVAEQAHVSRTY